MLNRPDHATPAPVQCPSLACTTTLDQQMDEVAEGGGPRGSSPTGVLLSAPLKPCSLPLPTAPTIPAVTALPTDAPLALDLALRSSRQSSATTGPGAAGESSLSNMLGSRVAASQSANSSELWYSPLVLPASSGDPPIAWRMHAQEPADSNTAPGPGSLNPHDPTDEPQSLRLVLQQQHGPAALAARLSPPKVGGPHQAPHQVPPNGSSIVQRPGMWQQPLQLLSPAAAAALRAKAAAATAKAASITAALPLGFSVNPLAGFMGIPGATAGPGLVDVNACMRYIPVTLRPQNESERAATHALRAEQRARFAEKKRRLGNSQAVRYQSRKRYADSRPRINGRFIRKADLAAMQAHADGAAAALPMHGASLQQHALTLRRSA